MLLFKLILVLLLMFVIVTLFTALYQLTQNKGDSCKVVRTLAWRVSLSIVIFILLWVGQYFGLITPHGIQP